MGMIRFRQDPQHLTPLVFTHGKHHIKGFDFYAPLAVDLHVYAIDEDDRVIRLQRAREPLRDILSKEVQHPRNARLAVVLAVDILEYLADLFLCKTFRVKCPRKAFAFSLLMAQDCQDPGMKIPVTITWDPERQRTALTVTMPRAETIAFIP